MRKKYSEDIAFASLTTSEALIRLLVERVIVTHEEVKKKIKEIMEELGKVQ